MCKKLEFCNVYLFSVHIIFNLKRFFFFSCLLQAFLFFLLIIMQSDIHKTNQWRYIKIIQRNRKSIPYFLYYLLPWFFVGGHDIIFRKLCKRNFFAELLVYYYLLEFQDTWTYYCLLMMFSWISYQIHQVKQLSFLY